MSERKPARPFTSVEDLARRVPQLNKDELTQLASIGALNSVGVEHRRDALWQVARAARPTGELLETAPEVAPAAPLLTMSEDERLAADYAGTGMTVGRHPMAHRRTEMDKLGVTPAAALGAIRNGRTVRVAGNVIVRQRPGTAKGITFMSVEDETGISNVVVMPDLFEKQRVETLAHPWVLVRGRLQNVDNVVHVLAEDITPLGNPVEVSAHSHDFH